MRGSRTIQWLKWHGGTVFVGRIQRILGVVVIDGVKGIVGVEPVQGIGGIPGIESIHRVERIVRRISLCRIQRVIGAELIRWCEDVVVYSCSRPRSKVSRI